MALSKKCFSISANSILESVIALAVISICFYFTMMIISTVFTRKTSSAFYNSNNKINEIFYLSQINADSLVDEGEDENFFIAEEDLNDRVKKVTVKFKDTLGSPSPKSFYIQDVKN